jgi:hypothetical protein
MRGRSRRSGWGAEADQLEVLLKDFHEIPRESRSAIRKGVTLATADFVSDVKADASWSSRIPQAVVTRVSFSRTRPGVRVLIDKKKAPHARAYEGMAKGGNRDSFRHPVYGHDVWVSQTTRPFFRKNVAKHRDKVIDAIETALIQTLPRR